MQAGAHVLEDLMTSACAMGGGRRNQSATQQELTLILSGESLLNDLKRLFGFLLKCE
jgi:hypothetical protein